ncbi:MAG: palindromic element RPE5 domain-containing protein [Rickettsia aeschlimannii]
MKSSYTKLNLEKSKEPVSRGAEHILNTRASEDLQRKHSQFFKLNEYNYATNFSRNTSTNLLIASVGWMFSRIASSPASLFKADS